MNWDPVLISGVSGSLILTIGLLLFCSAEGIWSLVGGALFAVGMAVALYGSALWHLWWA